MVLDLVIVLLNGYKFLCSLQRNYHHSPFYYRSLVSKLLFSNYFVKSLKFFHRDEGPSCTPVQKNFNVKVLIYVYVARRQQDKRL